MGRSAILSVGFALAIGLAAFAGSSSASGRAVPGNEAPPSVSGQALEGIVLTANQGRWSHSSNATFGYQWRRCLADGTACADIAGSTDNVYAARVDDVGHTLRVAVTATTRDGSASAVSAPTAVVAALPVQAPHNGGLPTISGSPVVGRVVTATSGTWTGAAPIRFSYRWRRCSASGGDCVDMAKHTQSYRLSSADLGHSLRVLVTAGNSSGTASSLAAATGSVAKPAAPQPPQVSSMPRITGTTQQGQQLVGLRGSWRNAPNRFAYSWLRCDGAGGACSAIPGAHGVTYTVLPADIGRSIRFQVDARNAGGSTRAVSAPTTIVRAAPAPAAKSPPVNTVRPTITGTAQEGQTLTGSAGTWTNSPTKFMYTWMRCNKNGNSCDSIGGAHSTTYKLVEKDIGDTIRFRVKATNADGSNRETSNATLVVRASAKPGNTSPPTISGTAAEGRTLNGNRGSWSHNPTSYDFFWLRCDRFGNGCNTIGGARSSNYVLTSADVGATLRFSVTAGNSEGTTSATSVPTAVVQRTSAPPRPAGCPPGNGRPDQVSGIAPPQRLLVDGLRSDPRVVTNATAALIVRFHVTSTCGGSVQGALVYATATPYNQFSIPPEAVTGSDGWATLVFRRLTGFPVSKRQQLLTVFVRARKPGENLLLGISTRRLVSIPVRL
jgi:fibronectin-binding autotransporter adhesin